MSRLETKRLTLIPVDRTLGRALIKNRSHAERLTSGLLHRDFPDEDLLAKLPAFVQRLEDSANPALGSTAPPDPRVAPVPLARAHQYLPCSL